MSAPVPMCTNPDHDEQDGQEVPAQFEVTFPSERWDACRACADCIEIVLDNLLDESQTSVLITSIWVES